MRWLIRSLITVIVFIPFFMHIRSVNGLEIFNTLEHLAYDYRVELTMPNTRDAGIVIVDVDEKSIAQEGQWPWPRDILAKMVDTLFDVYKIDVLGFDIQFPEPDRHEDLDLLNELEREITDPEIRSKLNFETLRKTRNRDQIFANSIAGRNVVLGFTLVGDDIQLAALPKPLIDLDEYPEFADLPFRDVAGHVGNFEILQNATEYGGNFNPLAFDSDGKIRSIAMLAKSNNKVYESLSLAVARLSIGAKTIGFIDDTREFNADTLRGIALGDTAYPIGDEMRMYIPYRGIEKTFKYISAADVLNQDVPKELLENVIVLVGSTASGLRDLRVAPIAENFPGVEMNANMVSGLLLNRVKYVPPDAHVVELLVLLFIAVIFTLVIPRAPILLSSVFTLLVCILLWLGNMALWERHLIMPISTILLFTSSLFFAHLIYGSFVETRRKKQLTKLFGQYVPPELVDEMETDLTSYSMETKEAVLTVMFADIKGFTTLSESIKAEQVSELLNEFLTTMTGVIHDKRGTIDKYMGDAIMAFWGAPLDDEDHAKHALEAALLMQNKMHELNANLSAKNLPNISIVIGVNTGTMSVGNMGSEFRMAYTVIGDAVNLAARLEALTRVYGVQIMIGENTRMSLKNTLCLELDKVMVKGKRQAVAVYEPIGPASDMTPEQEYMIKKQQQALQLYREQNWPMAIRIFQELREKFPEKYVFELYLERIEQFLETPPGPDWDGVYRFTSK